MDSIFEKNASDAENQAVQATQQSPFGIVGRKMKALFAATSQPQPAAAQEEPVAAAPVAPAPVAAPGAPFPGGSIVIIRNCSTKQVLDALLAKLGGEVDVSGRYFAPAVQDPVRIRQVAAANDLFVKESRIRNVVIFDLMVDRTIHPFPARRHPAPFRPRRDYDEMD